MNNWKCESGTQCAEEADKQGVVRYGTAGVAVVSWTSRDKAPSKVHLSGSVTCPSCQAAASFETDCDTGCDLISGPNVTCPRCSSRVVFSVWARKSDGAPRLFVTGQVLSRASGMDGTLPVVSVTSVLDRSLTTNDSSIPLAFKIVVGVAVTGGMVLGFHQAISSKGLSIMSVIGAIMLGVLYSVLLFFLILILVKTWNE